MGREIRSVQKEPEHLMRALWGTDNEGEELRHRKEMFRSIVQWYSKNDFIGNSNVLTWLLGKPPTSFESFARSTYARLMATPVDPHPSF